MVHALLACHDTDCTTVYEAYGPLEELESLACDCGCALGIVRYLGEPDTAPSAVELIRLAA
ncbi:MAG TPA: hypothetical protein VNB64_00815 [Solirubrobacteraceae bacterium]|nr:hypothetical protein [Solirubrobacteraceae bacterium]